ncbi:hypothetical protein K432DRAFT_430241 [Lepidopterella palustris CBS 459.81]|uniref:Vacuolar import and degradation protein 21 n=1 Tax=Lepidopterella palustris CBS 459.81 TaxID=1314670 RepID=A0A8E2DYM4_9PEZI|nr:hypothetical protein K432DRAFT_430241 [Lepidopterella palustris CBS 459.81]
MSLDDLRDATSREKKNEITNCELSRKRKLRELYAYTALLNAAHPRKLHDFVFNAQPDDKELAFLDENDIAKGRYFQESTLPSPYQNAKLSPKSAGLPIPKAPTQVSAPSSPPATVGSAINLDEQRKGNSASPPLPNPTLINDAPGIEDGMAKRSLQSLASPHRETISAPQYRGCDTSRNDVAKLVDRDFDLGPRPKRAKFSNNRNIEDSSSAASVLPDGPSVDPQAAIPVTAKDVANLPQSDMPHQDSDATPPPPQVVHTPPKENQEQHLQEFNRGSEKSGERERKEDDRLGLPHGSGYGELASSPSSTVGPYSTATPRLHQHSPDTSPDEETFRARASRGTQSGARSFLQEQITNDEQDIAQKSMSMVVKDDSGSPKAPEPQSQLDREQAIQLVRDSNDLNSSSRAGISREAEGNHSLAEHANDIAREAQSDVGESQLEPASPTHPSDSLPTPTTNVPERSVGSPHSEDTVVVKVRTYQTTHSKQPTPPADVEMQDLPSAECQENHSLPPASQRSHMVSGTSSNDISLKPSEMSGETSHVNGTLTPRSGNASASESPSRLCRSEAKRKSTISTVIFAKQDNSRPTNSLQVFDENYASLRGASQDPDKDYLHGLFQFQAHHQPRSIPLQELLGSARKTVTTANTLACLREVQDYKILKRVYQLQNANRWSLRQMQKSAEPPRPCTHLDHLLAEMKWMQTDFQEERNWKKSLAKTFARWCMEFVNSSPEKQKSLLVNARIPTRLNSANRANDDEMHDAPTPDLIPSGANETESESFPDDDELLSNFGNANPPVGLFSLGFDDVVMKIDRTAASDALLQELPSYEPSPEPSFDNNSNSISDPPILPVSKFITGKLVSRVTGPPRKRSRFEYEEEDEPVTPPSRSHTSEHSMPSTPGRRFNRNDLLPEMTSVALFNPENKHVRDRIQAGHAFRPPSEFPMPSTAFFEARQSSQWLWDEDQKLRTLVKDYTFNWSLIASTLCLPSSFTSGAERRTPWECFERWVQLEGLPAEMSKTQYFRTYQSRLEAAQRTVSAQHQALQQQLQQQAQSGGPISSQIRRRTTQPIRVERRKNNRYLAVIDGMRKLARKREQVAHKQQESAKAAQLRKAQESTAVKTSVHTPQEFSRLKWEREEKIKEKHEQYRQTMARQAAANAQRQVQAPGQPSALANGVGQPPRNGTPNGTAHVPSPLSNPTSQSGHPQPGNMQARTHPGQPGMQAGFPNGNMPGLPPGIQGIPQAQMQAANMQNQQRMPPPENMRLAMQRGQYQAPNQHQFQLQQQQINIASSLTGGHMGAGSGMPSAAMMASMGGQNINGNSNPSMNGMPGPAASPRMSQVNPTLQNQRPLSNGHMPTIQHFQNQLRNAHPDWTPEQIVKAASDQMKQALARNRASAMSAAAGASAMGAGASQIGSNVYLQNGGGGLAGSQSPNSAQYQRQLSQHMMNQRTQQQQQQQQQQQAGSPGLSSARPPSRSGTPLNPQLQQSPGLPQAQLAGRN